MSKKSKKKRNPGIVKEKRSTGKVVLYRCLQCNIEEEIPRDVVEMFDIMDLGDPTVPPRFTCEKCGGEMRPKETWINSMEV